jgi:putative ABC transport system permease protein
VFLVLAFVAAALSGVGLYSTMSYELSVRRRELAIRQSLGATPNDAMRFLAKRCAAIALAASAVGGPLGMWGNGLLYWNLFGVYPVDAQILVASEIALLALVACACAWPIVRAVRFDSLVDALR